MLRLLLIISALSFGFFPYMNKALAAGDAEPIPHLHWHFDGVTGTYDKNALQRGFQVYREVCSACHSMNLLYFRDLQALGYSEAQIKNLASEYEVMDGPDDEGEMFSRPAIPSDRFPSPYANKQAAMYANNGAYPPDMSLLSKARHGGANYIYSILTGYEEGHEKTLMDGQYWNKYMPGHVIAMAPPLSNGQVSYQDGSPETVSQYSKDVSEFLTWASEPHMEVRKYTGIKVFLYLLVFSCFAYAVKRKVWSDVH